MVEALLHPLNIFIVGLGGAFLIPLLYRLGGNAVAIALVLALAAMTLISGVALWQLAQGGAPIEILTGGAKPPVAINLRLGLPEAIFIFSVNLVALFGAPAMLREAYGTVLIYLLIVMGIQGMVMTRDLFNLFVFLEIVSIATYGLLSLRDTPAALAATFKFLMATVLASGFFLIGTVLLYAVTGLLNIDDLIASRASITGPIGMAALIFLLACLLLELKPFPANGWGLDVYETARPDVAALISGGVSAGVFFALLKLLPLFEQQLPLIAVLSAITFVFSNLIGLRQTKAQRLLGYSSIGQMALMTMAAALLYRPGAESVMLLVIGALFVNHLFAKVGLFWLAGYVGKQRLEDWSVLAGRPVVVLVFVTLLAAISGFPPFPGFWAKWHLVLTLAADQRYVFIVAVMLGSLLEVAYLFRWFGRIIVSAGRQDNAEQDSTEQDPRWFYPAFGAALVLVVSGYATSVFAGLSSPWVYLPLAAGFVIFLLDGWPGRVKGLLVIAIALTAGYFLIRDLTGIASLFAALLYAGGAVLSIACLYRNDVRRGFYPMLAVTLLSLTALPRATTSLEFFVLWELISLAPYFLIVREKKAASAAFSYLLFSIASAMLVLAGFAMAYAVNGNIALATLWMAGPESNPAFVLLALGALIKVAAIGVHIWLPAAHAEADAEVSALLSAVITKAAVFGLLICAYVAIRSEAGLDLAHVLGWIGMLTTLVGAMVAVRQDDIKRMLAYSSMSQLGYIVAAVALMSHLGWVTALYLVANHLMVKGILFLVAGAVILRTGTQLFSELGGLGRAMPQTFAIAAIAIVAMSGLPPLAGFGGKWLLLSAMMEKGWYMSALMTLVATFVGFLYMARFIHALFLGERKAPSRVVADAPFALLLPQYLLVAGILIVSFFPKLLIEPVSRAIDPQFASTLRWQGLSLELIYATWNPAPVMAFAVAVAAILFAVLWLVQRSRPLGVASQSLYSFAQTVCAALTPPLALRFWSEVAAVAAFAAERSRRIYTGNGLTYNLAIVYYLLVLYAFGGGTQQILALLR
jgi:formate hydrogenlyase subunit 3/multisubunit Na+/H+ antiporter MnhD subunit